MKCLRHRKGFSLVEIMTVVSIIGLIAAMAVPNVLSSSRRSRDDAMRANLAVVRAAVDAFRNDTGLYPSALANLSATSAPATGIDPSTGSSASLTSSDWRGPYLRVVPNDIVSNAAFGYTSTTGVVLPSATGNDARGVAYSTY